MHMHEHMHFVSLILAATVRARTGSTQVLIRRATMSAERDVTRTRDRMSIFTHAYGRSLMARQYARATSFRRAQLALEYAGIRRGQSHATLLYARAVPYVLISSSSAMP
jgi:hypothetical protein